VCGKLEKRRNGRKVALLECDKCLRGFHLDCLQPPLAAVPEVTPTSSNLPWSL
jgi:hypothetical protein